MQRCNELIAEETLKIAGVAARPRPKRQNLPILAEIYTLKAGLTTKLDSKFTSWNYFIDPVKL